MSKEINSRPIFITNISSKGHTEKLFILNHELIKHCELMNYDCVDMAKNVNGKVEYWRDGTHTSKQGSEIFAKIIYRDLKTILEKYN